MSVGMVDAGTRPVIPTGDVLSPELREVVERHLEGLDGLPTKEHVEAICRDTDALFYKGVVLKYFLLESPLRASDLRTVCLAIGSNRAVQICQEVRRMRDRRLMEGWHPRWEGVTPS